MAHQLIKTGGLAAAGAAAAMALSAPAASAAVTKTLTYKCKFPVVGTQPVQLDLTLDIPDSWPVGGPTAPFGVTGKLSVSGSFSNGWALIEGLKVVGGVTEAQKPGKGTASRARVELPDGTGVNVRVPLDVQPYSIVPPIPNPFVLNVSGTTPSLTLDVPGIPRLWLTDLILNLYGHYEDGSPVEGLTTPPTDIDRLPYADIDGDPGTFNVPCKLDPAIQDPLFPSPWPDPDPVNQAPTKPGSLTGTSDIFSVTLSWAPSTDSDGLVAGYNVYRGDVKVAYVTGTTATISGLIAGFPYSFSVEAVDDDGLLSPRSDALAIQTKPAPPTVIDADYTAKGSTTLKTLTKGTLNLTGKLDAQVKVPVGELSGTLTFDDASGRLVAGGFLPVTAKVGLAVSGLTTGYQGQGKLTLRTKFRLKVKEVKLFGAIPLVTGNTCQTKTLSDLNLDSTQPVFDRAVGGPVAGTYAISDLNGCGALNGLVSPLTAGGGNTIALNLTPAPPTS